MKHLNKQKGFTIVELVIVIAVIAVLSAVLIPTFSNIVANAQNTAAKSNAANIYKEYIVEASSKGTVEENVIICSGDEKYVVYKNSQQLEKVYTLKDAKAELGLNETQPLDIIDGFENILIKTDEKLIEVKSVNQLFDGAKVIIVSDINTNKYCFGNNKQISDSNNKIEAQSLGENLDDYLINLVSLQNGYWEFKKDNGTYLRSYAAATNLKFTNTNRTADADNYSWTISVNNDTKEVSIQNKVYEADETRCLRISVDDIQFGNYTESGKKYLIPKMYLVNE